MKTTHIWDSSNIALELNNSNAVSARYIRGVNLIKTAANVYFLYNAHGDVVQLTNSSGAVTKNYRYDAFGVEIGKADNDTNPWRYCGEYWDEETGTVYLRARRYDPRTGRFTQEDTHWNTSNMIYGDNPVKINERDEDDPLALNKYTLMPDLSAIRQSSNLYVYCGDNPVCFIDSNGHGFWIAIGALVGGIISAAVDIGIQVYEGASWNDLDWKSVGVSFVSGAVSGALGVSGVGLLGQIVGNAVISGAASIAGDFVAGESINWAKFGINATLGGLFARFGGPGLQSTKILTMKTIDLATKTIIVQKFASTLMAQTFVKEFIKNVPKNIAVEFVM